MSLTHRFQKGCSIIVRRGMKQSGGIDSLRLTDSCSQMFTHEKGMFGIVTQGEVTLTSKSNQWSHKLCQGMYFSINGTDCHIDASDAKVTTVETEYSLQNIVGGPVESKSRLKYLNGSTTSVLIPPMMKGMPSLHLLNIPRSINQTVHTHPSHRYVVVVDGSLIARVAHNSDIKLSRNDVLFIPKDTRHSFHTQDLSASLVTYHPESDGPTDKQNPMINKTEF